MIPRKNTQQIMLSATSSRFCRSHNQKADLSSFLLILLATKGVLEATCEQLKPRGLAKVSPAIKKRL
jgi:hypothetical protein